MVIVQDLIIIPVGSQNGMHVLSYTLAESSVHCHFLDKDTQGQSSVFRDMLLNKTGREREAPVRESPIWC